MSNSDREKIVVIRCRDDGPLVVDGRVELRDGEGQPIAPPVSEKGNIALCRCGFSESKPFCDGAHREHVFCSVVRAERT